ncbi:Uncharacterised protein [Mycobacteroides abscessus]|nr:Uncharacterised protein [Mycobacteroides abscessus]
MNSRTAPLTAKPHDGLRRSVGESGLWSASGAGRDSSSRAVPDAWRPLLSVMAASSVGVASAHDARVGGRPRGASRTSTTLRAPGSTRKRSAPRAGGYSSPRSCCAACRASADARS